MALIDESLFKDAQGKTKPGLPVPEGRKRVAYRKMVTGLAFLGLFVFFSGKYNFGVALEPWFVEQSLPYRYVPSNHAFSPKLCSKCARMLPELLSTKSAASLKDQNTTLCGFLPR